MRTRAPPSRKVVYATSEAVTSEATPTADQAPPEQHADAVAEYGAQGGTTPVAHGHSDDGRCGRTGRERHDQRDQEKLRRRPHGLTIAVGRRQNPGFFGAPCFLRAASAFAGLPMAREGSLGLRGGSRWLPMPPRARWGSVAAPEGLLTGSSDLLCCPTTRLVRRCAFETTKHLVARAGSALVVQPCRSAGWAGGWAGRMGRRMGRADGPGGWAGRRYIDARARTLS